MYGSRSGVSLYDCVFVFGCQPHCVCLSAIDDFVSQRVSELSWHLRWACASWSVHSLWGACVGMGFVRLCALCMSLGLCLKTSVVECAFVSVV